MIMLMLLRRKLNPILATCVHDMTCMEAFHEPRLKVSHGANAGRFETTRRCPHDTIVLA